jgi:hypothetical protein
MEQITWMRLVRSWEDKNKMNLTKIDGEIQGWIHIILDKLHWGAFFNKIGHRIWLAERLLFGKDGFRAYSITSWHLFTMRSIHIRNYFFFAKRYQAALHYCPYDDMQLYLFPILFRTITKTSVDTLNMNYIPRVSAFRPSSRLNINYWLHCAPFTSASVYSG